MNTPETLALIGKLMFGALFLVLAALYWLEKIRPSRAASALFTLAIAVAAFSDAFGLLMR